MLSRLTAVEFIRPMGNGKTGPCLLLCEDFAGDGLEVIVKFSIGCEQKEINLAHEVISACLAADLGLPIPQPYLIDLTANFIDSVTDTQHSLRMKQSNSVAFGSKLITGQYSAWGAGSLLTEVMLPHAAAILTFDGIIQNPDRRSINPNCLVRGDDIRIIDHDLAFAHSLILFGWRAPWVEGGLHVLEQPGFHIFRNGLKGKPINFAPIKASWQSLTDAQIQGYSQNIPPEWASATNSVVKALQLIKDARDNIDACITEIERVLQ